MKTARCPCGGPGILSARRLSPAGHEELYFCLKCAGRFTTPAPEPSAGKVA